MRQDWISPWWQAAVLPDMWDVCGVTVPSLSVWHTFALENIGNHYLCGGSLDKDDAASLLLIASRTHHDGLRLFHTTHYRARAMKRVHRVLNRMEWEEVDAACREYVDSCMRVPSRWQSGDGKVSGVPYQWHLLKALSGGSPDQMEAAWNTPYAVGRCMFDAYAESKGDTNIMSPAAQEMEDNWEDYKDIEGTMKVSVN